MTGPRAYHLFAQISHLLSSRTRQRQVFGPGWIMLIMGGVLGLDAVLGDNTSAGVLPDAVRLGLVALMSAWAGWISWQHWRSAHTRELLPAGVMLALGGAGVVLGMHLQLPWALLLIAFALRLLFGREG